MKAVVVNQPGDIEVLEYTTVDDPVLGPDKVLIDTKYAACNWMDTQKRRGVYPDKEFTYPTILGNEVSGVVAAVGKGVENVAVGDHVSALMRAGGYAEKAITHKDFVIKLPEEMDLKTAALFPIVTLTAYHLLHTAAQVKEGHTVLIHAIGGAVGLAATQIAKELGANVIGTVTSNPEKAKSAYDAGADLVVMRSGADFVEEVMKFTDGKGADLCIDSVGGDTGFRSFDALRFYGRLINIGETEGWPKENLRDKLYERSTSFAGFETIHSAPGSSLWQEGLDFVIPRVLDGRIDVPLAEVFALKDAQDMHRKIESRTVSGKLLLQTFE